MTGFPCKILFDMNHTVCMLIKEVSILKHIVPPTVPSGFEMEKEM